MIWTYTDNTGVARRGVVERTDSTGAERTLPYYFRRLPDPDADTPNGRTVGTCPNRATGSVAAIALYVPRRPPPTEASTNLVSVTSPTPYSYLCGGIGRVSQTMQGSGIVSPSR